MRIWGLFILLFCLAAAPARAEVLELDSCTDANGQAIAAELDSSLPELIRLDMKAGQRLIRYNPDAIADLSATARQFFFAQACARLAQGDQPGSRPSAVRARSADCLGLATLKAAGLIKDGAAVAELQEELEFTDEEWALLPGPRREFHLTSCPSRNVVTLPLATPPTAAQLEWNACVRQCGDRLFRCRGAAGDCQANYDRCQAACPKP